MNLKNDIEEIIEILEDIQNKREHGSLNFIIKRYKDLKKYLITEQISKQNGLNPVKGSVRAYLDVYSDYENPVLAKMYKIEKAINRIIDLGA